MQQIDPLNQKYEIMTINSQKGGVFGLIKKATHRKSQKLVAIKELRQSLTEQGIQPATIRQISALDRLKSCPNAVQLIESLIIKKKVFLVFPFIETNLRQYMTKQTPRKLRPKIVKVKSILSKTIMKQLLNAVKQAHESRIIHRDIKPENILIENGENQNTIKLMLADWGSSRFFNITTTCQNFTQQVIPLAYRAPQILFTTRNYSTSVDMWSVGCIFAELLLGQRIFLNNNQNSLLFEIVQKIGLVHKEDQKWLAKRYSDLQLEVTEENLKEYRTDNLRNLFSQVYGEPCAAQSLLKQILRIHPDRRISARQALKHEYFDLNK